jgi:16S rRNA (uracil1498-N3)-methyltransferase
MQYLYHNEAGVPTLTLRGDEYKYIFKVRRHKRDELITLRNLIDNKIYFYKIVHLDRKEANLLLQESRELVIKSDKSLDIGWCVIEAKNIERTLPTLNELGVNSITFIYCKRSQKNFRLDFKRLNKILINSSQQCGRSELMKISAIDTLSEFIERYPNSYLLNFSDNKLSNHFSTIDSIVIGCEGGFSEDEVKLFEKDKIVGLNTPLILKSQSAVCSVASKILI